MNICILMKVNLSLCVCVCCRSIEQTIGIKEIKFGINIVASQRTMFSPPTWLTDCEIAKMATKRSGTAADMEKHLSLPFGG